jgi:hypothetical protein
MLLQYKTRVTEEDRNNLCIKLVTQYEFPEFSWDTTVLELTMFLSAPHCCIKQIFTAVCDLLFLLSQWTLRYV